MSGIKQRVATLLSQGIGPSQVAKAVGCSPSYISDMAANDAEFQELVQEYGAQNVERECEVNESYANIEKEALDAMSSLIPTADMRELSLALKSVNDRNTRVGQGKGGNGQEGGITVAVQLPSFITQNIQIETNERNEIIEVQGKSMISLTPAALSDKLNSMKGGSVGTVIDVASQEQEELSHEHETARPPASSQLAEIARVMRKNSL